MTNPANITLYASAAQWGIEVTDFSYDAADPDKPGQFPTREDAQAFAALFPKSLKVRGSIISGQRTLERDPDHGYGVSYTEGYVQFAARLWPNGVTGEKNETGIARYRSFRKHCERLGVTVVWRMPFTNSLSEAQAEELMA